MTPLSRSGFFKILETLEVHAYMMVLNIKIIALFWQRVKIINKYMEHGKDMLYLVTVE